jgi:hypothetical protein
VRDLVRVVLVDRDVDLLVSRAEPRAFRPRPLRLGDLLELETAPVPVTGVVYELVRRRHLNVVDADDVEAHQRAAPAAAARRFSRDFLRR